MKAAAPVQLFREGLSEEAATPEFIETRRSAFLKNPPDDSPSRITGHRQLCYSREQAQCISRLHCSHSERIAIQSQSKIDVELCENCGGQDFLVEREGKGGENGRPQIYTDEHG